MSLVPPRPFSYQGFQHTQGNFVKWVVDYVERDSLQGRSGWLSHLQSYDYSRPGHKRDSEPVWQKGINSRLHFNRELRYVLESPENDGQKLISVVNEIMVWGGMKPYNVFDTHKIRQALLALDMESMTSIWDRQLVGQIAVTRRVAARTKIFEMYDPDNWVIYDSRVACALACLNNHALNTGLDFNPIFWPIPQGRVLSRNVNGYPGANTPYQASLGFLLASWLCRMIAQRLNLQQIAQIEQGNTLQGRWRTFHVEMVLWVLGAKSF